MRNVYPLFHTTISAKELRPNMPPVPFLLSAASFLRENSKGQCSLRTPRYLPASLVRGADCGGFTATMRWGGHYRFTPVQYVRWLYGWRPQWAATFDLLCLSQSGGDPGEDEVKARQRWTTKMAWHFWLYVRDSSWSWTPTIQGYHPEDFERHARSLLRLIREMQAYYFDPGWGEDEDEGPSQSAFRVGIGSLCRRSPAFIQDVVARVRAIIGEDIALHLWGVKLRVLQAGLDLPGVISCDSGAWNGLYGKQHEQRRASGLSVVEYSWRKQYPDYARKLALAQRQPPAGGARLVYSSTPHKAIPRPYPTHEADYPILLMKPKLKIMPCSCLNHKKGMSLKKPDQGIVCSLIWLSCVCKGDLSMKTVTVVEMQTRLCEMLAQQETEVTQVTYQGKPVVAVLALERYQALQRVLSTQREIEIEVSRESLTQGQLLFHSYAKRLAPRLQGQTAQVKIIEVMRREKVAGALLAWEDWQQLAGDTQADRQEHASDDHTLTIVGARNHLLRLPEQFAREEHQGIFAPVLVSKQGDPVLAIVSWGWFERVTRFLRTHLVPFTRMERDGTLVLSSNEAIEHTHRAPEHLRPLWTQWSLFHQRASELAVTVVQVTHPDSSGEQSYATLEEQCATAVHQGQELLSLVTRLRHEQGEGSE